MSPEDAQATKRPSVLGRIRNALMPILNSGTAEAPRPTFDRNFRSNVPDLYVIGDLAGAPVVKLAMEHGYDVIEHIASLPDAHKDEGGVYDVVIVGAGAAGLNAALEAKERGLSCIVLEKEVVASTIVNFPEGKWVYAEPDDVPPKGKLWLDGASKEELLKRWYAMVRDNAVDVRVGDGVRQVTRDGGSFRVETDGSETFRGRRVILAIGQRGNARKLGVPGEDREQVYHRLYAPKHYKDEDVLVVGGGNSAVEAALTLSEQNRVLLSYRRDQFSRIFKDNERNLNDAVAAGRIRLAMQSNVTEFGDGVAALELEGGDGTNQESVPYQHAFVLIGAELPVKFLRAQGIRLEGEWTGNMWRAALFALLTLVGIAISGGDTHAWSGTLFGWAPRALGMVVAAAAVGSLLYGGFARRERFSWLGITFLICYTVYGVKVGSGKELWPFRGWGNQAFSFAGRPWTFWYTILYTAVMTVFGLEAMRKWGIRHQHRYQVCRFLSLILFQWVMFFLVPEYLFHAAVEHRWVGARLAADPQFAGQAWRAYGIVYAWPLFFYTFFYDPHQVWVVWGVLLTFVLVPVLCYFHGKRYCTWICGCGGLAETLGDRWRALAPKGKTSIKWERMGSWVLALAFAVLGVVLARDVAAFIGGRGASRSIEFYKILVDVWLVGIIPVALYPFMGGKVWCRYWCPLAKLMQLYSKHLRGRFAIKANDKCIACYECSRHCQVGIPVMQFALKQEDFGNWNSSCIGCGICVTVCPMNTLSFGQTNIGLHSAHRRGPEPGVPRLRVEPERQVTGMPKNRPAKRLTSQ